MYEERFGTDWDELEDREEAVRRAFALGVAARLGETHRGELDRISAAVDTSYDRSFVELAYHEGRDKASDLEPAADADEDVWEELVTGETRIDPTDRPEPMSEAGQRGLPEALDGVSVDTRPDDTREAVGQPKFLDRDTAEEPDGRRRARRNRSGRDRDSDDEGPTDEEREAFEEMLEPDDDSDG